MCWACDLKKKKQKYEFNKQTFRRLRHCYYNQDQCTYEGYLLALEYRKMNEYKKVYEIFRDLLRLANKKYDIYHLIPYNLGLCYYSGMGVDQNVEVAFKCFSISYDAKEYYNRFKSQVNIPFEPDNAEKFLKEINDIKNIIDEKINSVLENS